MLLLGLASAVSYGAVAVAVNFINKASLAALPLPNTILMVQIMTTLLGVKLLSSLRVVHLAPASLARVQQLLPLSACYTAHALLVLYSLQYLNVPMYNTLKRMTPVMVLCAKSITERRLPDRHITASVALIVSGCVVAGAGDLDFHGSGYLLALACAAAQAAYMLLAERTTSASSAAAAKLKAAGSELDDLADGVGGSSSGSAKAALQAEAGGGSPAEILFYSAAIGTPVLVAAVLVSGEAARAGPLAAQLRQSMGAARFGACGAVTAVSEGLLTGSLVLCTKLNSALTTAVVGVLKGVVAVLLGFVLLGGVKFSWVNVTGIALNTLGGVWYAVAKYRQAKASSG